MKRLLVSIAAAVLPACTVYDPYYSNAAYYDAYNAAYEATYAYGTFDPYGTYYDSESGPQSVDLEAAAAAVAARAGDWFTRSDCVKASSTGERVYLELDDCEARLGGKNIDGNVGIVLSQIGEQFRFVVRSSNLRVSGDEFILDFDAAATSNGTQRVVTFDSRTRNPDQAETRNATGTMVWEQGNPCLTINAQSTSESEDVSVSGTLVGYVKCADQCPAAGEVTVQGGEGVFFGTFDGDDNLRVNDPNGGDRMFGLECR